MVIHQKIALFTIATLAGLFVVGQKAKTVNAEDINVYTNSSVRNVTHVASGGLYAMSDANTPNISLLEPLNPKTFTQAPPFGQQIPNGEPKTAGDFDSIQPAAHKLGAKVIVRLPDLYPKFPYNFSGLNEWKANVTKMVEQAEKNNNDIYAYEIWNEPGTYWPAPDKKGWNNAYASVTYDQLWNETWHIIKDINPNAKIVGPSLNGWNNSWMKGFLQNAKDNHTMPDYISWHQWNAASYPSQVKELHDLEDSMGISRLPISINEYAWRHELAVPGDSIHYIQNFEDTTDTDSADLAFWYDYGRMDNLLTNQQEPNGGYWLYKWYGDMSGHIDTTSTYSENGNLASVASTNQGGTETNVIFGGTNGDNSIVVNGLSDDKFANGAKIQVSETPWYGVDTAVKPKTIATGNLQVKNGSITVPVKAMKASSGYQLLITPADSKVTNDNLQYTPTTANNPIRVEAEDSQITDGNKADGSYASNGHFVSDLNNRDSSVDMSVNALQSGDYSVEIGYGNGASSDGAFNISLNGEKQKVASFAPTGGWIGDTPDVNGNRKVLQYGTVHLNKGENHFVLTHASGYSQLDYAQFTLAKSEPSDSGGNSNSTTTSSNSSQTNSSTSTTNPSSATTSPNQNTATTSTTPNSTAIKSNPSTPSSSPIKTPINVPNSAAKKGTVIYATKKINLYKTATFKKSSRIATYAKRSRINRPTFVVTGYSESVNGVLRYQVRASNGQKGYITTNGNYVQSLYYQTMPKSKRITAIAKNGVNAYQNSNLTKHVKHFKHGTQLKVKKIIRYHLTTRYQLTNNNYISGNKKLIIQGSY